MSRFPYLVLALWFTLGGCKESEPVLRARESDLQLAEELLSECEKRKLFIMPEGSAFRPWYLLPSRFSELVDLPEHRRNAALDCLTRDKGAAANLFVWAAGKLSQSGYTKTESDDGLGLFELRFP